MKQRIASIYCDCRNPSTAARSRPRRSVNLVLGVLQLLLNLSEHVAGEGVHVVLLLPAPIAAGAAIVQAVRPRVSDGLTAIGLVVDGEVGHVLLDVLGQLGGSEGHGGNVVHALGELAAVSLHQLQSSTQAIGHVHHGQRGVSAEEASVVVVLDGLVEDIDGVIGGATAGKSLVGDNSGVSQTAEVQSGGLVVVLTEQLQMDLGHSVHGGRSHDSVIGGHLLGGGGTEGTDGGGNVQTALVLTSNLDDVLRSVHVDLQSLLGHLLTDGGEQSAEVDNPGNAVLSNQALDVGLISHIQEGRGSRNLELSVGETQIRGNDVLNSELLAEDYNSSSQTNSYAGRTQYRSDRKLR